MKVKYISRRDWPRILASDVTFCEKHYPRLHAMTSLFRIHKVTAPLFVPACGQPLCAADDGYAWLHVLPENENWCLTAMFDETGATVQYYFDITQDNILDGCNSRFTDLYLDIVCLPDGRTELIDQPDLDQALADGLITQEQYDLAKRTAQTLQPLIESDFPRLSAFLQTLYSELNA